MSLAKQEANPGFAKNLRMFSRTPAQKQGIKPIGGAMTENRRKPLPLCMGAMAAED